MNIFHAFLFNKEDISEPAIFRRIIAFFQSSERIIFLEDTNLFTKRRILKLKADDKFVISFQYETGQSVIDDYRQISKGSDIPTSRIRVLMSPDEKNEYDDIAVMVLQLLSEFTRSRIYNMATSQFFM